jgi:hypothetical protein
MYSLDSLRPDRLRCDRCGHALPVALDAWDDPESIRSLTEDEAAAYWPRLAADLRLHGMCCPRAWFAGQEGAEAMGAQRRASRQSRGPRAGAAVGACETSPLPAPSRPLAGWPRCSRGSSAGRGRTSEGVSRSLCCCSAREVLP